ncbi:MAG: hypothetical protein AAGL24_18945 [Pseudomonadota bacterium]
MSFGLFLVSVALCALFGFGLGFRLGFLSLFGATVVAVLAAWLAEFDWLRIVAGVAAFQLSAFAAMIIRHRRKRRQEAPGSTAPLGAREHPPGA